MTDRRGRLRIRLPLTGRCLCPWLKMRPSRSALDEQPLLSCPSIGRSGLRHPAHLGGEGFCPSSPGFPILGVGSTNQAHATNPGLHASAPNWYASAPSRVLAGPSHRDAGPSRNGCWIRAGGSRTRLCRTDLLPTGLGCACPAKGVARHESRLLYPQAPSTSCPHLSSGCVCL